MSTEYFSNAKETRRGGFEGEFYTGREKTPTSYIDRKKEK